MEDEMEDFWYGMEDFRYGMHCMEYFACYGRWKIYIPFHSMPCLSRKFARKHCTNICVSV